MKLSELFPSKSAYYSTKSIDKAKSIKAVIAAVAMEDAYSEDPAEKGKEKKPVIVFEDGKKLGLNKTNGIMLGALFGEDTEAWVGKEIVIWHDPTVRGPQGNVTGGLRVRGV